MRCNALGLQCNEQKCMELNVVVLNCWSEMHGFVLHLSAFVYHVLMLLCSGLAVQQNALIDTGCNM